jgi:hypothetical protein
VMRGNSGKSGWTNGFALRDAGLALFKVVQGGLAVLFGAF